MGSVANIFCHPVKGIGRLQLTTVDLLAGKTMPFDRHWAVMHEASKFDKASPAWTPCNNFIRGAKAPELQAITVTGFEPGKFIELQHTNGVPFRFNPDNAADHAGFINWLAQFVPANRAAPDALVKAPERGMTDSNFPSISILNRASLRELSNKAGQVMEIERFRGNIWLDGLGPWAEFDWIGKTVRIGSVELIIRERIGRCMATTVNPATGKQDVATLKLLQAAWGHTDFGVFGEVIKSGRVSTTDTLEIL